MTYEQLQSQGRIKPQPPNPKAIRELLALAERDVSVAARTLEIDPDWTFTIAYNAVLQASRALMFSEGFRPRGPEQHTTVVRFLKRALGEEFADDIAAFDSNAS